MRKAVFIVLTLAVCSGLLSGCRPSFSSAMGLSAFHYEKAERYTAGGAALSDGVERVEIHWLSGSVKVAVHKENTVRFSEEANRALSEDESLHYWLDGTTLRIQFCGSGERNLNDLEKDLTVLLPEELMLKELIVDDVSAKTEVGSIKVEELNLHTVSGNLEVAGCTISESADFDTTSGNVKAEDLGVMRELRVGTVSGKVSVEAKRIDRVDMDSTSGDLCLEAGETPDRIHMSTVSGAVTLVLPEDAGMTLRFHTVSGSLSSELAGRENGKYSVFGDGSCECSVETTSGDLKIKAGGSETGKGK